VFNCITNKNRKEINGLISVYTITCMQVLSSWLFCLSSHCTTIVWLSCCSLAANDVHCPNMSYNFYITSNLPLLSHFLLSSSWKSTIIFYLPIECKQSGTTSNMSSAPYAAQESWILWSRKAQTLSRKSLVWEHHGSSRALAYLAIAKDRSLCSKILIIIECTLAAISTLLIAKSNICKSRK